EPGRDIDLQRLPFAPRALTSGNWFQARGQHDLRIADLSLCGRTFAGFVEALREHHARAVEAPRYPAGGVLDGAGRRWWQSRPALSPGVGILWGAGAQVECFHCRSRMDLQASRERERRA